MQATLSEVQQAFHHHFLSVAFSSIFMPLPVTTGDGGITLSGRLSNVCPSVTSIAHDAISLSLVEGFQQNLPQIFIT